jgi:hypothetical protein
VQIVAEGVCADLYGRSRQYDDKAQAEAEYDKGIAKMIKAMGNRTKMVDLEVMPDLSMYE